MKRLLNHSGPSLRKPVLCLAALFWCVMAAAAQTVTLVWDGPTTPVTGYRVYQLLGGTAALLGETTNRLWVVTPAPTIPTIWRVTAFVGSLESSPAETAYNAALMPLPPRNLTNIVTTNVTVTLVNGSFEASAPNWGAVGWTITGNCWVETKPASQGTNCVRFNVGQTAPDGTVSQTVDTVAGGKYVITFDAGIVGGKPSAQAIRLTVKGVGVLLDKTVTLGPAGPTVVYSPQSATFTADGSKATLTFQDVSPTTDSVDLYLDNVVLKVAQ